MNLSDKIVADIKEAMKAGEKLRLETLRSIRAAILEFEKSGADHEMTDEEGITILNRAAKKRKDAIDLYATNGRDDAAAKEQEELDIISSYLPDQLRDDEVMAIVKNIVEKLGASGPGDFGKVMGMAMKELKGKTDGSVVQNAVKELLS